MTIRPDELLSVTCQAVEFCVSFPDPKPEMSFTDIIDQFLKVLGALTVPMMIFFTQRGVVAYESAARTRHLALQRQILHGACDAAAGTLVVRLARGIISIQEIRAESPVVMELARRTARAIPGAIEAMNVDAEDLARVIVGKVGVMLPADPTVQTLLNPPKDEEREKD